jgi:transposase
MYVAVVPNRNSPPAILLRESFRENGKVHNRTLANISQWPPAQIAALREVLKGAAAVAPSPADSFQILRSLPHGHVAAVVGSLRQLGLDSILDTVPARSRDLAVALIAARLLDPCSKLATARALHPDTLSSSLSAYLGLEAASEDELYRAMDWLLERQPAIEAALAKRHLAEGGLVLYDLTSTYFEGRHCELARLGHSRDDKSGKPQIVFGLLTNGAGCPVAVEVFEGNTADPKTVPAQVKKLRERFALQRMILVGDRGMITSARIREDFSADTGIGWITALRATSIQKLAADGALQLSLYDTLDLAEIAHPAYPGERLVVCFNPVLSEERARKREDLLQATERELEKIACATRRQRRPLRGKHIIGLRVGRVLGRFKMGKHYQIHIEDDGFRYERRAESIEREKKLDGIYVIRTNVPAESLPAAAVVRSYKQLSGVERAFRSLKTVDLHVRPIHHRLADRVRAHVFLCMLAYYVEWHMRSRLAPLLFDDHDKPAGEQRRQSIVKPAQRSAAAESKARTKRTADGKPVHSFQSLLADLATLTINRIQPAHSIVPAFDKLASPTALHKRAFALLGLSVAIPATSSVKPPRRLPKYL